LTGAAFLTQTVTLEDGQDIKFEIWDTVSFPNQRQHYCRSSMLTLLAVLDILIDSGWART